MAKIATVVVLVAVCAFGSSTARKVCPKPGRFGTCGLECFTGGSFSRFGAAFGGCGEGKLCCSTGCGTACMTGVEVPDPIIKPVGQCPPASGLVGICVFTSENCLSDSECGIGELCCSEGCGRVCKPAV